MFFKVLTSGHWQEGWAVWGWSLVAFSLSQGLSDLMRVLWKRLYMEMPHKKGGNPSKTGFFETFPQFLQEKWKSLKTQFFRGFLFILRRFLKFLRGFRFSPDNYFWGISQYFWGISQYFWGISTKFLYLNSFL